MNAQDILEKSFFVVRDVDSFVLYGNWVRDWRSLTDPKLNGTTRRAFQLSYRKPNEMVLVFQDSDVKFRFVGSSIFIKGPDDERAKFVGATGIPSTMTVFQAAGIPAEIFAFIHFCLSPKENCLWYIKRNCFRLVQVKEQANKLFLEGDLGSAGIVRFTVSSISYFIHSMEITTKPVNTEFAKEVFAAMAKTGEFFDAILSPLKNEKPEDTTIKHSSLHIETELSFDRVSLNPKLSDADFLV